jgi:hypothetical protein
VDELIMRNRVSGLVGINFVVILHLRKTVARWASRQFVRQRLKREIQTLGECPPGTGRIITEEAANTECNRTTKPLRANQPVYERIGYDANGFWRNPDKPNGELG